MTAVPQVTFVIPAYNAARTLKVTANSLRAQTCPDWEAIIVDDGSSDRTAHVAAALARADSRFRLVRQENAGPSAARNLGLAHASARLVTFIDADDWIAPDFLASLVPFAAAPDTLAFCAYERVLPSGRACPPDFCAMLQHDPLAVLAFRCEPAIHCVVAPRDLIASVGGFDPTLRCCEDWDLWLRVARAGARFVGLNRPLAAYRMEPGSLSTQDDGGERDAAIVAQRARQWDLRLPASAPFRGPLAVARQDTRDEQAIRADIARLTAASDDTAFSPDDLAISRWREVVGADPDAIPMWIAEEAAAEPSLTEFVLDRLVPALHQGDPAVADSVVDAWWMCRAKATDGRFGRYLAVTVDLRAIPRQIEVPSGVDTAILRMNGAEGSVADIIAIPVDGALTGAEIVQTLLQRVSLAPLVRSSGAMRSLRFWGAFGARLLTIGATSPLALLRNSRAVIGQAVRAGISAALGRVRLVRTRALRRDLAVPVLTVPTITANDSALLAPTIGYHQLAALIALLVAEGYRGVALREVMALRDATAAPSRHQIFALVFDDLVSARQCGFLDRLPTGVSSVSVLLSPEELEAEIQASRPHRAAIQFGIKVESLPLGTREALDAARRWLMLLHQLNHGQIAPPAKCVRPGIHGELLERAGFAPIIYPGSTPRRLSSPGVIFPGIECAGAEALGTVVECLRAA